MLRGFREFLLRGNVVDLAVAVAVGAAFSGVVKAFAEDFVGGIIGAIGGSPDFGNAGVDVGQSRVVYGSTLTAAVNFVIVAAVIYFVIVVPLKAITERGAQPAEGPALTDEAVLLAEIRDELRARPR